MDPGWCYPCRLDASGVAPHAAWGLDTAEHEPDLRHDGPMGPDQVAEVRFLCGEFGEPFDPKLTEGEAAVVVHSFLDEPMSESQARTLAWLSERAGIVMDADLNYGRARTTVRRLLAVRGLRSA